ncbi:MAG: iron-sulfur cluster assembly scaffold protein [Pseudobacteriovorax sp.]|nr:iron-sulfur cluster assembly scaffold protein [Pseudobacteriovorax sp.]
MSSDNKAMELYQKKLLDLNRNPVNYLVPDTYSHKGEAINRNCGDTVELYLATDGQKIVEAYFAGESCAVCKSSASVMVREIANLTLDEAKALREQYVSFTETWDLEGVPESFEMFLVMKKFPTRKNCLLLPWDALKKAIDSNGSK